METQQTKTIRYKRHPDDPWIDEIRIEAPGGPLLRLRCYERWKSSYLSGDEWRFSYNWEARTNRGWEIVQRKDGAPPSGSHRPRDAALLLYGIVEEGAHQATPVTVHLYRKGHLVWTVSEVRTLRDAAGHLPWDLIIAGERHDAVSVEEATKHLCAQPGCRTEPTACYLIKQEYDHCGNPQDAELARLVGPHKRCFCEQHRHRGDCALEDADTNYELLEGAL